MHIPGKLNHQRKVLVPYAALLLVIVIEIVSIAIALSTPKAGSPIEDDSKEGLRDFYTDISAMRNYTVYFSASSPIALTSIENPENTLYVITGIEKIPDRNEINSLEKYLDSGGKVILAYDGDPERIEWLIYNLDEYLGFRPHDIYRVYSIINDTRDVVIGDCGPYQIVTFGTLGIHSPSRDDFPVMAINSVYLDLNGNGIRDSGDISDNDIAIGGRFSKNLFFIGDTSIFTNYGYGLSDNREFIHSIIESMLPDGGNIIIDGYFRKYTGDGINAIYLLSTRGGSQLIFISHDPFFIVITMCVSFFILLFILSDLGTYGEFINDVNTKFRRHGLSENKGNLNYLKENLLQEEMRIIKSSYLHILSISLGTDPYRLLEENPQHLRRAIGDDRLYRWLFVRSPQTYTGLDRMISLMIQWMDRRGYK